MRSLRSLAATFTLYTLSLGSHCVTASAQNAYFTTGTYTIDYPIIDNGFIGEDSSGDPYNPTVNLVKGGSVGLAVESYNSSQVNVSGGTIGSFLQAFDSSQVNISAGSVGSIVNGEDSTNIQISGGTFGQEQGINFFDQTDDSFILVGNNLVATNVGTDPYFRAGTDYDLSGTLVDGTNLSGYVLYVRNGSSFTLQKVASTPEPGSMALVVSLALSGMAFLRRSSKLNRRLAFSVFALLAVGQSANAQTYTYFSDNTRVCWRIPWIVL